MSNGQSGAGRPTMMGPGRVGGGAPSGGVASVTGNPAALVDNTDSLNPVVQPSFGENTSILKANAAAILKTIWQGIASYISNVNGAETSQWTLNVLQAGAQVAGQVITGLGTIFPDGVFTGVIAETRASVALGVAGTGIRRFAGLNAIAFDVAGREIAYIGDDTANGTGHLRLLSTFARILLGDDCMIRRSVDTTSSQSNLELSASFAGNPTDVVIGVPGASANGANGGFLQMPTMPGIPTGAPLENTGKFCWVIANTAVAAQLYTWKGAAWSAGPLL